MAEPGTRRFVTRAGRALDFSAYGFGAAPLGNMHRALGESEVHETLAAAWKNGLRYFDTAPLYGRGLSEMRVGEFLANFDRRSFLLSTKVGRLLEPCAPGEEDSGIYKDTPHLRVRFDYSRDGILRSYEASLKRLMLDRIDILYVHDVDARSHGGRDASESRIRELMDRGGWRALQELRAGGDVTAIGIGVNEWEPCARMLELADPDLFLLAGRYTLLEQEPLETLFPECEACGVGIVVGGPFNSGILARGSGARGTFDYAPAPAAVIARVRALKNVCRNYDVPLAAGALQFPLAHPAVVSVIAGAQSAGEIAQNAGYSRADIPAAFWAELKSQHLLDAHAPVPGEARTC